VKPRVVHVSSVHPSADTRIFVRECQSLAQAGYEVTLIAGEPAPMAKTDVRVRARRIPSSRLRRFLISTPRIVWEARRLGADIYHLHDPELLPLARVLRGRRRAKIIYDAHEDLPQQLLGKEWVPDLLRPVLRGLSGLALPFLADRVDAVVAATPRIADTYKGSVRALVRNYPLLSEDWGTHTSPYSERESVIVYIGGLSQIRGGVEMYAAMDMVPAEFAGRLVVVGPVDPPGYERALRRHAGAARVDFLGWQNRTAVLALLSRARVGLVVEHPLPSHLEALPTKLFEYMAAGIPVVASDFPLWRGIVEAAGCGIVVDPLAPEEIAKAIVWLLGHPSEADLMGRRGIDAVRSRYNWDTEATVLLDLYLRIMNDRGDLGTTGKVAMDRSQPRE
jgi:glycosyltransferase involved in cell wall biosynthesis